MIYNPFIKYYDVLNYINELQLTIDGAANYEDRYTLSLSLSGSQLAISIYRNGDEIEKIIENFDKNGLINYIGQYIFISVRKPSDGYLFDVEDIELNPSILNFTGNNTTPVVIRTEIAVASPIKCIRTLDRLIVELDEDYFNNQYAENKGITSINGILPDDNGNINIISKSPEVLIVVSNNELSKI